MKTVGPKTSVKIKITSSESIKHLPKTKSTVYFNKMTIEKVGKYLKF